MLLTFSHLILTIARIISHRQVKDILLVLIETLVHQKKSLVSILVKQRQSFVCVCITRMIIVICWLKDKKVCKFKANNKFPNQCSLRTISNKYRSIFKRKCLWPFIWLWYYWWIWHMKFSQVFNGWECFWLIKKKLFVLLSLGGSLATNVCRCNKPCIAKPTQYVLNSIELNYYLFMFSLNKCNEVIMLLMIFKNM